MKNKKTYYQLIIDRSGSMFACMEQMVEGINRQIMRIREIAGRFPEREMITSLTLFNDEVLPVWDRLLPEELRELTFADFRPEGNTALLDAIGITVKKLQQHDGIENGGDEDSFVVIIVTDGYENASRHFTLSIISDRIRELESTGRWTFSYMGSTLDAVSVAAGLNIRKKNAMSFTIQDIRKMFDKVEFDPEFFSVRHNKSGLNDQENGGVMGSSGVNGLFRWNTDI